MRTEELRILRKQAIVNAFFTFSWTVAPFTVSGFAIEYLNFRKFAVISLNVEQ